MIKSLLRYLKWTPLVAGLAIAFTLPMRSSTAHDQPLPEATAPVRTDLSNEERVLGKYLEDLTTYERECRRIEQRPRIISTDLDGVQRRASELKDRLSEVQNSVREVVRKLKAANEWDDLDTAIVARITDPNERREFQQSSFKRLLEEASNGLTSHSVEITAPFENLRRKVGRTFPPNGDGSFTIVSAAYRPEAPPVFLVTARCMMAGIRRGIIEAMGNKQNARGTDLQSCACHPEAGLGLGTNTPCSECC